MIKVVLNDILINLRKNWISILFSIIALVCISIYLANVVYSLNSFTGKETKFINEVVLSEKILRQLIPLINGISFIYLFSIMKKIPLRLSKGIFVCAAGEKEKMKYIYLQLAVKIIFSFIFIFAASYLLTGRFFPSQGLGLNIIQLILWFFIVLNINLKIGIGEEGLKKKDKDGYIIYSKEEEIVNYYWICLGIIEAVIFYTLYFINIPLNLLGAIGWIVIIIINVYIANRCVNPILKKSLSYEDVYRQTPERKEVY